MSYDCLTVHTEKVGTEISLYKTWWLWGGEKGKQGVVDVRVNGNYEHNEIIAELGAIHHLLEVYEIGGGMRGGNNLKVNVGFGAIKKLKNGKSRVNELLRFGRFLRCRFKDAEMEVSKSGDFIKQKCENNPSSIEVDEHGLCSLIKTKKGEIVKVSWHAHERMMQRWNMENDEEAWRKMMLIFGDAYTELVDYEDGRLNALEDEKHYYNSRDKFLFVVKNGFLITLVHSPKTATYLKIKQNASDQTTL